MKKIFIFLMILMMGATLAFALDPAEGLWKSVDEKTGKATGVWKVYVKDNKLFGEMCVCIGYANDAAATSCKESYDDFPKKGSVKKMALVGTPFIYNLEKKGIGNWYKGYIIDPGSGKRYKCKITFFKADGKTYKADTLRMRGEIGLGIGRNQWWLKSSEEELEALIKGNTIKDKNYIKASF